MTDTTTSSETGPVDATPLSFDEGVNAIAGLLDDDPVTEPVKTEVATSSDPTPTPEATAEEVSDEDLVLDDAELAALAEPEVEAPSAINDDTEVALEDGTKISIAQLKRNNLFQRDYTRKTEELKAERQRLDAEHQARVSEADREIASQREQIFALAREFLPEEPTLELFQSDPIAYVEQKALYDKRMKELSNLNEVRQRQAAEADQKQKAQFDEYFAEQRQEALKALPHLKDKAKLEAYHSDVGEIGFGFYGIKPEEFNQIADSRYFRVLHDAIQFQKLKRKASTVQKAVTEKPKLISQQRQAPQAAQVRDRQGRFEALRQTGSLAAAAKSIEDLID